MAESRRDLIALKGDSGQGGGTLYVELPNSGERMGRAMKLLGICWGLAVVTLFIPIAHFFLVPLFLIAGPVLAIRKYQLTEISERAEGQCPECQEQVTIPMDPAERLPKRTYCPACNRPLQLVYHAGPSGE